MKNAGKACNNRLYRHIRTFEKIVKNYFVIYMEILYISIEKTSVLHISKAKTMIFLFLQGYIGIIRLIYFRMD